MDKIPESLMEKMNSLEVESKLKHKMQVLFALAIFKQGRARGTFESSDFGFYKDRAMQLSDKINKWHKNKVLLNLDEFNDDSDYEPLASSPCNILSSDEDSIELKPAKKPPQLNTKSEPPSRLQHEHKMPMKPNSKLTQNKDHHKGKSIFVHQQVHRQILLPVN